jgi:alkanesulfonate monooxygenase SsuD/methylene tetrahydromethanopterin reductase-like flavin-dependent oxidoreductase (luciferase family)
MTGLTFGFSLLPTTDLGLHTELVAAAEEGGLDLVGIQDHPYVPHFVDIFALAGSLLERTSRLRIFPDVASLPLRPPAMLAKACAALDLLSGGRFELGLGAGGRWDAINGMGVTRLGTRQANDALAEAVAILRALWRGDGRPVWARGTHYTVQGPLSGPAPAHPIGIWLGSQGPRSLRLCGRIADGWAAPIAPYLPYERWAEANAIVDRAAEAAGRRPGDVLRIAQIVGTITDRRGAAEARQGADPVRGTPDQWAALIARLATEQPFTSFIFWTEQQSVKQVARFATEVVPAARELLHSR